MIFTTPGLSLVVGMQTTLQRTFFLGRSGGFHVGGLYHRFYCALALSRILSAIIVFHSFIIAMVRYTFIIHPRFVESKGKANVKNFFFWIILLVAFVTTLWKYFGSGDLDSDPYVNKCRGKHHLVFLRFKNAMEGLKGFCNKEYDSEDISSYLTAMAKKISCIVSAVIFVLMGLNVTEGFLYIKVIKYVKR